MPTSSVTFSASIQPDRRLRFLVLSSGTLLMATGVLVIVLLPFAALWRVLLIAVWLLILAIELGRTWCAYQESCNYRLYADGSIDVGQPDSGRRAAVYAAGSVILPRLAWLRVRAADGSCWGELVAGNPRKNKEWRRFQVICRLLTAC